MNNDAIGAQLRDHEAFKDAWNDLPAVVLSDADIQIYQNELWQLLKDLSYRYTMRDSTSLPIETANELLRSAVFCIGQYFKCSGRSLENFAPLKPGIVAKLFESGRQEVLRRVEYGRSLLRTVMDNVLPIRSLCYLDTLDAIGDFFRQYDVHFMAHKIPCAIDYPLCHPLPELFGIEYILAYLKCLHLENTFCGRFNAHLVLRLLINHWPDYELALVNVCDPVFINAMGLCLLEKDVFALDINGQDKDDLRSLYGSWSKEGAEKQVKHALRRLMGLMDLTDDFAVSYFGASANDLLIRMSALVSTDGFDNLFVTVEGF